MAWQLLLAAAALLSCCSSAQKLVPGDYGECRSTPLCQLCQSIVVLISFVLSGTYLSHERL